MIFLFILSSLFFVFWLLCLACLYYLPWFCNVHRFICFPFLCQLLICFALLLPMLLLLLDINPFTNGSLNSQEELFMLVKKHHDTAGQTHCIPSAQFACMGDDGRGYLSTTRTWHTFTYKYCNHSFR